MLTFYQTQLKGLLQNPGAPVSLYSTTDLNRWINVARAQIAGESRAIRFQGTINTVIGQRAYNFSTISTGTPATNGVQGVLHVRALRYGVGVSGAAWVQPRNWEWFDLFCLNVPAPVNGAPTTWSQYGQGSAGIGAITGEGTGTMSSGNFYLDPPPDAIYALTLDCVCYPILLSLDTDVEALPFMWTDAVPFFAAYYALLSSQTNARIGDAERYFGYFQNFMARARNAANPDVNTYLYSQADDPTKIAKLGLQQKTG